MKNVIVFPFTILCMVLALSSCSKTNSYAADIYDLNGTWQPDWSYKATLAMPEEERDDSFTQCEYSWGIGKSIPNTIFSIDITTEEPFIHAPGASSFYKTEITQTGTNSIKINAVSASGWAVEVIFHFIDRDTLWIETENFTGSREYGKGALWHRLSGPATQERVVSRTQAKQEKENINLGDGYINDNNLRIRSNPDTNAEILGILNLGDYVSVIDITEHKTTVNNLENYWYKITTNENITGWIFGEYLELIVSEKPAKFAGKNWNSNFGSLSPVENFTLNDLQSCSWKRNDVILIFSGEGHYARMGQDGYYFGRYILGSNMVHFFPPLKTVRFAEEYTIISLHYSNEMYYEGTPVLKNDDETVIFSANEAKEAMIGETVKLHQYYCEKIWERGTINTNSVLYSLPDITSKNMFQDNYYGRKSTDAIVVKLAKTTIGDVIWYYTLFDFTSGEPSDGGGPFYDGWLPQKYFE